VRDGDVRRALHAQLRREHAHELSETKFLDEVGLCGEVRVDVTVLNGELAGYELKSARDTLRRLPTQIDVYSRVLDRATLVVADNHREGIEALLPTWWGLIVASSDGVTTCLEWKRRSERNPSVDPASLAQLLWRDEVLAELAARGLARGFRSKSRMLLSRRLSDALTLDELRALVRTRLKQRAAWRVVPSPRSGGGASRTVATSSGSRHQSVA